MSRDLLKRTKAETRKLSELSKTEQNRLAKLHGMLDELRRGENVQNRRLGTWLTEAEYEGFKSDQASQQQIREELTPHDLRRIAITHAVCSGKNTSDQICNQFNISIDTYRKHYAVYEPVLSTFKSGLTTERNASTVALFPRPHNLRNKNNKLKE
mgnify:CR=1 FL=1